MVNSKISEVESQVTTQRGVDTEPYLKGVTNHDSNSQFDRNMDENAMKVHRE